MNQTLRRRDGDMTSSTTPAGQLAGPVTVTPLSNAPQPSGASLRILLLEDEPADAELIERELSKAGLAFIAKRVETKRSFIETLDSFEPDVLLLDCKLPDYSGAEALAHVRRVHPEVPVVIVTGTMGDEAAIEFLKAGAKDYVLKDNLIRLAPAVERVISVEQGIRARKAAERELRRSEEDLRALLAATVQWVWKADSEGRIVGDVPAWRALTGQTAKEMRGHGWMAALHPDDVGPTTDGWIKAVAARRPFEAKYRVRGHDGAYRDLAIRGAPLWEGDGTLRGWIGSAIDITEHEAAQRKIREEETKFRSLVEQNVAGIVITRADGTIGYVNSYFAAMNGYTAAEVIGRPLLDFVPEAEQGRVLERLQPQLAGTGGFVQLDTVVTAKDGHSVDVLVN
ncbi:MAG TPA: PAS domain S-box protein, partial [Phycisphaerae bacterium]|nr:PAS domain S-box protein [Phycisphaerae bacterium]